MPETRGGHVYRVEFFSREIPQCYRRWAIRDFTHTSHVIWVRTRKRRDALLICDRSARADKHEYRQCKRCGRRYLGFVALMRRAEEEHAQKNGLPLPPCCLGCG